LSLFFGISREKPYIADESGDEFAILRSGGKKPMAPARLYIAAISLCLISTACAKKAKMRTVPRQTPAPSAGLQAAPSVPPPGADEPVAQPTPPVQNTETVSAPAPAPAAPVARLDDSGENRRVSRPAPAPRREIPSDDRELNRPRPRVSTLPPPRPRTEVIVTDCIPPQREARPLPPPRPHRPVIAKKPKPVKRIDRRQQFELDPADELHCRWEPTGKPLTYLKYDPVTKTAFVQHGWPQKWSKYTKVRLVTGLPPYGNEGLSLVSKSGVPIAHLKATGNGTIWYERGTTYPYESYFGNVPGAPQGEAIRGVCWTKSEPAVTNQNGG
jgi:hypothetical protein